MFIGRYSSSIGAKGRVAVPVKFRESLGTHAIISQGYKKALFLISTSQWEQLTKPFINQPLTANPMVRDIERFLLEVPMKLNLTNRGGS